MYSLYSFSASKLHFPPGSIVHFFNIFFSLLPPNPDKTVGSKGSIVSQQFDSLRNTVIGTDSFPQIDVSVVFLRISNQSDLNLLKIFYSHPDDANVWKKMF